MTGAGQIGWRDCAEAVDRPCAGGSEFLQCRRERLRVVVPFAGETATVEIGKRRIGFAQDPADSDFEPLHVDVTQMEEVLSQREDIRRRFEGELLLAAAGGQSSRTRLGVCSRVSITLIGYSTRITSTVCDVVCWPMPSDLSVASDRVVTSRSPLRAYVQLRF